MRNYFFQVPNSDGKYFPISTPRFLLSRVSHNNRLQRLHRRLPTDLRQSPTGQQDRGEDLLPTAQRITKVQLHRHPTSGQRWKFPLRTESRHRRTHSLSRRHERHPSQQSTVPRGSVIEQFSGQFARVSGEWRSHSKNGGHQTRSLRQ